MRRMLSGDTNRPVEVPFTEAAARLWGNFGILPNKWVPRCVPGYKLFLMQKVKAALFYFRRHECWVWIGILLVSRTGQVLVAGAHEVLAAAGRSRIGSMSLGVRGSWASLS